MDRAFRIIKLIFLILGLLLLLAIPVSGLISTVANYSGICHGFTDGQVPCPWEQYALNEMFWASFLFIPFLLLATLVWLGMSLVQFIAGLREKAAHRRTQ
jgi:hypothetical protein